VAGGSIVRLAASMYPNALVRHKIPGGTERHGFQRLGLWSPEEVVGDLSWSTPELTKCGCIALSRRGGSMSTSMPVLTLCIVLFGGSPQA
jgi:hypothetical protein